MAIINKHIQIVRATAVGLSSMGEQSAKMLHAVLSQRYSRVEISNVGTLIDLDAVIAQAPDLIFLGIKQLPLADTSGFIWVADYLDAAGINYTGSTGEAIALDFDKAKAKDVISAAGLATSSHFMAKHKEYRSTASLPLGFPLFIKPPNTGGGKGIGADSVVRDFDSYQQKVASVTRTFKTDALVEGYLEGREFSVAILSDAGSGKLTAMPIELVTEQNAYGDRILGANIKAADTEQAVAVAEGPVKSEVIRLALDVFAALGARDYGRIDIRLDHNGLPHFLEANLIPGVAQHEFTSYFTSACLINEGIDYESMVYKIVSLALRRSEAPRMSNIEQKEPLSVPALVLA